MHDAQYWIEKLQLAPHPEGGFFRQTYRSPLMLRQGALPANLRGDRSASTAIYFLLEGEQFSAFHRIGSDELWHFYAGNCLSVYVLEEDGGMGEIKLGPHPQHGEVFQAMVPSGRWFASCLAEAGGFALVGCTVSPGFDFADFEMADRSALITAYPQHGSLITQLTRQARD